jgi:soluble lytic murein transglycosylase
MRLSVLHLIFAGIATAVFVVFIFAKWQGKNEQIKDLNKKIQAAQERGDKVEKLGSRVLAYVRVRRGLDVLAGQKLSDRQKEVLTKRLLEISSDFQIDPLLILAIIRHESRGNPNAKGTYMSGVESGALGLMQIKYESAVEVASSVGVRINSPEDLFVPEKNLMVGTAYLLRLIAKYQNLQHALMAYNVGFVALNEKLKSGGQLPQKYYNSIIRDYKFLAERVIIRIEN